MLYSHLPHTWTTRSAAVHQMMQEETETSDPDPSNTLFISKDLENKSKIYAAANILEIGCELTKDAIDSV